VFVAMAINKIALKIATNSVHIEIKCLPASAIKLRTKKK
jgi:hypothetical protein